MKKVESELKIAKIKNIKIWKIVLLSICTLGLYTILWLVLRRKEINKVYGFSLPNFWWPISLVIALYILFGIAVILVVAGIDPMIASVIYGLAGFPLTIAICVVWVIWLWKFSKAAAKITEGKTHKVWVFVASILALSFLPILIQPYFNSARTAKQLAEGERKNKVSKRFVGLFFAFVVLEVLLSTGIFIASPDVYTTDDPFEEISVNSKAKVNTTSDIRDYFIEIAIGKDASVNPNFAIQKWEKPQVYFAIEGNMSATAKQCLDSSVATINSVSKEIQLKEIKSGTADIAIYSIGREQYELIDETYESPEWAWSSWSRDEISWETAQASILIDSSSSVDDDYRCAIIPSLLAGVLGLTGYSYKYSDSIFYAEDMPAQYSEIDKKLFEILYGNYGITPGSIESKVLERFETAVPTQPAV